MSQRILDVLKDKFGDAVLETHSQHGDDTAIVARERWAEIARFLRDDPTMAFDHPTDITATDYLGLRETGDRFEVVCHLRSLALKHRIRIKARVPEDDCHIASLTPIWNGFNWFEREIWDMYGIKFDGHPDLRRMFMYDEFVGHPLRKDYPKEKRQPLARREGLT
jgi:NADH-quinone oxidoreductase subunit C